MKAFLKKLRPRLSDLKMVAKFAEFYYAVLLAFLVGLIF